MTEYQDKLAKRAEEASVGIEADRVVLRELAGLYNRVGGDRQAGSVARTLQACLLRMLPLPEYAARLVAVIKGVDFDAPVDLATGQRHQTEIPWALRGWAMREYALRVAGRPAVGSALEVEDALPPAEPLQLADEGRDLEGLTLGELAVVRMVAERRVAAKRERLRLLQSATMLDVHQEEISRTRGA